MLLNANFNSVLKITHLCQNTVCMALTKVPKEVLHKQKLSPSCQIEAFRAFPLAKWQCSSTTLCKECLFPADRGADGRRSSVYAVQIIEECYMHFCNDTKWPFLLHRSMRHVCLCVQWARMSNFTSIRCTYIKKKYLIIGGGQSTQPYYLSQSVDLPGQMPLHYEWK